MKNKLALNTLNQAVRFVLFQLFLVILSAILFLIVDDEKAAVSALLGGIIYVLPNYIFTRFAFRFMGARQAKEVAASFSMGATIKLVLTAALFGIVLSSMDVKHIPLYITFAFIIMSQMLIPYFINKK